MTPRTTNKDAKAKGRKASNNTVAYRKGDAWSTTHSREEREVVKKKAGSACFISYSHSRPQATPPAPGGRIKLLRERLDFPRKTFARLMSVSERSLASLESGAAPSETVTRRSHELQRLVDALAEVIQSETIGPWLMAPNEAFDRLKPIEVIERGEADRIWQMIFLLRSGASF